MANIRADEVEETDPNTFEPGTFTKPEIDLNKVHFVEVFEEVDVLGKVWKKSNAKKDNTEESLAKYDGEWEVESPSKIVLEGDLGLVVKSKAKHHAVAAVLPKPIKFDEDVLVVQYEVKYQEGQECGGGYLKLLSEGAEKNIQGFTDGTEYTIMFGPDKCGPQSKVHFILKIENPINKTISEHHAAQPKTVADFTDGKTHLFKLVLKKNNDFSVYLDDYSIIYGNLVSDLQPSIQPPKQIDDPNDKKPEDWDEREKIVDESASKPNDWDEEAPREIEDVNAVQPSDWLTDEEPLIPDPAAEKPVDWDDEMDGEYEAKKIQNPKCIGISGCGEWKTPMIPNPAYKGKWAPPLIANPKYKGKWLPRMIDNPNFYEPNPFIQLKSISAVGFELWTINNNILFDNLLIASDEDVAQEFAKATYTVKRQFEDSLEASENPSHGFFKTLISATEERPYLWAVYILAVLIPVIAISAYFFGQKSGPTYDQFKKNDEVVEDEEDEIPEGELIEDPVESQPSAGESGNESEKTGKSPKVRRRGGKVRKVDE